jgi:hypothetical protein
MILKIQPSHTVSSFYTLLNGLPVLGDSRKGNHACIFAVNTDIKKNVFFGIVDHLTKKSVNSLLW